MSRRGPTTHSGRTYRVYLEEGFVYSPLKGKSYNGEESETSSFGESTHSDEDLLQD